VRETGAEAGMKAWETAAKERARKAMTRIFDLVYVDLLFLENKVM
jgi:hypothetical protein